MRGPSWSLGIVSASASNPLFHSSDHSLGTRLCPVGAHFFTVVMDLLRPVQFSIESAAPLSGLFLRRRRRRRLWARSWPARVGWKPGATMGAVASGRVYKLPALDLANGAKHERRG